MEKRLTKDEAKEKLRRAESDLRVAKIVSEEHEKAIKEIKENIEKLKAIINKKDNWKDKLTKGDYVVSGGLNGLEPWHGYNRLKAEHTFKTREQAQLLADKMNLMQQMHAFAHVRNEGWVPDWGDISSGKWGLRFDAIEGVRLDSYLSFNVFVFGIAVKSQEIAEEMLAEFGDRIEKIYNKQY